MRVAALACAIAILGAGASAMQPQVIVDHVILGIGDLDRGIAEFEQRTGLRAVPGGVHPGRGTQNALASLGNGTYLEILAPDPKQPEAASRVQHLAPLTTLTPVGWAVGARDLNAMKARAGKAGYTFSDPMPGSREMPDGRTLAWSTMDVTAPAHEQYPFFIQWTDPALQPSRTSPGGCSLVSVQLRDPNPAPLTKLFEAIQLKVIMLRGDARMTVVLQCPTGRVTF